jgi:surfeit locus 1 family protein
VRLTGRPIHGKAIYIPRSEYGKAGFEYIVPFVTKENEDHSV